MTSVYLVSMFITKFGFYKNKALFHVRKTKMVWYVYLNRVSISSVLDKEFVRNCE